MLAHGIEPIDLLVVNLYPFEATVAAGKRYDDCIENIDIGGPAMIRAAAKNHADVAVVVDVADYDAVLADLDAHDGAVTLDAAPAPRPEGLCPHGRLRCGDLELARRRDRRDHRRAFARSAARSRAAALRREPASMGRLLSHARAAAGRRDGAPGAGQAALLQQHQRHRRGLRVRRRVRPGADGGGRRSSSTPIPAASARRETLLEAYEKALRCDPVSAFGGIVALNRPLDADAARKIVEIFTEVIIAPDASEEAHRRSSARRRTCGCCSPAACPIRARRACRCAPSQAGFSPRRATTPSSTTWSSRS